MSDCLIFAVHVRHVRRAREQLRRRARSRASCSTCRSWPSTRRCCCSPPSHMASPCWRRNAASGGDAGLVGDHRAVRRWRLWASSSIEFAHMIHEGATPQRSAFLSSFFALVGTHGLHVSVGIIWLVTLMIQVGKHGLIAGESQAPRLPEPVLALPRCHLDRRLHLRLSVEHAAMSTPHAPHDVMDARREPGARRMGTALDSLRRCATISSASGCRSS